MKFLLIINLFILLNYVNTQHDPHWLNDRNTIVHLFEWKFKDIANECETFLSPNGYAGVQLSPVNEYLISSQRAWWERYQPISYNIISRSGDQEDFLNMTKRCNKVGVRIYADVVINHMAAPGDNVRGVGGTLANPKTRDYPGVPYTNEHFNPSCQINNYFDSYQVRNCELSSLPDLNQTIEYVREKIVNFMNNLVDLGVAGFRIDACKHMWPHDINIIFNRVKNLSKDFDFPENSRPFFYQEVIDLGTENISKYEYYGMGAVTEFLASLRIGNIFRRIEPISNLLSWGSGMSFLPSYASLIFVDNHDNQRGHGAGGDTILTYKNEKIYKMAISFLLAHPFGITRIMSSYEFSNSDQGPPMDNKQNIISPIFNEKDQCINSWVCEHRWNSVKNMIKFRNFTKTANETKFTIIANEQITMCRPGKGFIAFNNDINRDLRSTIDTCLPAGAYCDVISGDFIHNRCTKKVIYVDELGYADIKINANDNFGVIAIHIGAKL